KSFIIAENERTVLPKRSSEGTAELISFERRNSGVKKISRIQSAVAQEFINTSMKRVRSRARYSVDNPACSPAVLSRIFASQNGKLLHSIHTEVVTQNTSRRSIGVVVDAEPSRR